MFYVLVFLVGIALHKFVRNHYFLLFKTITPFLNAEMDSACSKTLRVLELYRNNHSNLKI